MSDSWTISVDATFLQRYPHSRLNTRLVDMVDPTRTASMWRSALGRCRTPKQLSNLPFIDFGFSGPHKRTIPSSSPSPP
jgi:hypothetical protein